MSDIVGELRRVARAFETPTLTLLHQRHAPVVIAMFRSSFSRDTRAIPAALFHEQVDTYLAELAMAGIEGLPTGSGRDLSRNWVRGQWLVRNPEEDGSESYSLTSHARDALEVVQRLTRERASLSEHRITTIVTTVQRLNAEINPDRQARISILDREIAERVAERDRLSAGGEMAAVSGDQVLTGFVEVLGLIADLPSDFARVQEAFVRLRQAILSDFRNETRAAGEVIDDYLRRADELMSGTAEGRAFEGAFALLRDEALLLTLRDNIGALLDHPLAGEILMDTDRQDLRGLVALIRAGMESVLTQRKRVSATLREYIVTHDLTRDRELDALLRALDSQVGSWLEVAGPRASVDLRLLPAVTDVQHLRERFFDTVDDTPPPPLPAPDADPGGVMSLDELRAQGGPTIEALRAALATALAEEDPIPTLGRLFESLDVTLRRPVEILGLIHLAANRDDVVRTDAEETFEAIRADGALRALRAPVLTTMKPTAEPAAATPEGVQLPEAVGTAQIPDVDGDGTVDNRPSKETGAVR